MNELKDASGRLSILLSRTDSGRLFNGFADHLQNSLNAELVNKLDGLDERYWDFNVNGTVIVLHAQAMEGISIHVENGSNDDLLRELATSLLASAP